MVKPFMILIVMLGAVGMTHAQQHFYRLIDFDRNADEQAVYKAQKVHRFEVRNTLVGDSAEMVSPYIYYAQVNTNGTIRMDSANTAMGFSNRYTYNEAGNLTSETYYSKGRYEYITYTYDSLGRVFLEKVRHTQRQLPMVYRYAYNSAGQVVSIYQYKGENPSDTLTSKYLQYTKSGRLAGYTSYVPHGDASPTAFTYDYDVRGRLITIYLEMNGDKSVYATYTYPEPHVRIYHNLMRDESIEYHYTEDGLLEKKVYLSGAGEITGVSHYTYKTLP